MENTVITTTATASPDFKSVDYFTASMRENAHRWTDIRLLGLEYVKVFANGGYPGTEVEDILAIRNILAAVEIVRAELAEAKA